MVRMGNPPEGNREADYPIGVKETFEAMRLNGKGPRNLRHQPQRGIFEDKNAETVAANGGVGRTPVRPPTKRESWQIENDIKSVRAQQEKLLDVSRYGYTDGFLKLHKMADGGDVRAVEDLAAWHRLKERKVALESELRSL